VQPQRGFWFFCRIYRRLRRGLSVGAASGARLGAGERGFSLTHGHGVPRASARELHLALTSKGRAAMGRVGRRLATRRWERISALACVGAVGFGCAPHPDEGTVVEPAPGIEGVPRGADGVTAKQALAIRGGTLAISETGIAVPSDPDRDHVFLLDLATQRVTPIQTSPRAEPGRVVIDASGRAHIALRAAGEVLSIDLSRREVLATRAVCPAPRGLAY